MTKKKIKEDVTEDQPRRNIRVEAAVDKVIIALDKLITGEPIPEPTPASIQSVFDSAIKNAKGSVRLAIVFFIAYSLDPDTWDFNAIPVGIRGTHGDKKLASALTSRHVNFHMAVTAFGENLGWKGNVRLFSLKSDARFNVFITKLEILSENEREQLFNFSIWKLFQTRAVPKALPKLPAKYLTYSRALALCEELTSLQTEGHVQQFLVAAFLVIHRARIGNSIKTHHPHAADKFDDTCGDIEELRNEELVAAYEVTVRADWKNRLPDFHAKMVKGKLSKYVIIASNVHTDAQLSSAKRLLDFTRGIEFDLAVVDIRDFFCVFCAELSKDEISNAINLTYEFLLRQDLCGRSEFQERFRGVVSKWMEVELS
jgi:hypothetical protein